MSYVAAVAAVVAAWSVNATLSRWGAAQYPFLAHTLALAVVALFGSCRATLLGLALSASTLWLSGTLAGVSGGVALSFFVALGGLLTVAASRLRSGASVVRSSREWLRMAEESVMLGTWRLEVASGVLEASDGFFRLFGRSRPARGVRATRWRDWVHPEDRLEDLGASRAALAEGRRSLEREFRAVLPDGRVRLLVSRMTLDVDAAGRLVAIRGVTMPADDRRTVEQRLLASIVSSSDDAIVSKDISGRVTSWNAGAERLFGWTAAEMIGAPITKIIPPHLHGQEPEILRRLRAGERIAHFETERVTKEGQRRFVSLTISPVCNGAGEIVGASKVARDVTAQRELESERREMERRKDEFLAVLSPELRNPMAPIRSAARLLLQEGLPEVRVRWCAEVIDRQSAHLTALLDDLLDLTRVMRDQIMLKKQRVELTAVLADAIEAAAPLIEARGHRLHVDLAQTPVKLLGDPVRLVQVFVNLLGNAAKYSPPGSDIHLIVEHVESGVRIRVRDPGIGMDGATLARAFEPFARGEQAGRDELGGGLGVGLALARRLIEQHGGQIEAYSDGPGRGSEFLVTLHCQRAEGTASTS